MPACKGPVETGARYCRVRGESQDVRAARAKSGLSLRPFRAICTVMGKDAKSAKDGELSREERLAAKLRENLRRRKAQARASASAAGGGELGADDAPLPNRADEG